MILPMSWLWNRNWQRQGLHTVIFMIPKREHSVFEMLDSPIYMFIVQKSHLFMGKKPTYTFKSIFLKKKGNDFESAKREDIFQLLFSLLSLVLVTGKKYSKVTLQMVEIIHSISIHFPRLLWQPGLCHNYHNFIYSSGALWEVKQGGRNSD